MAQQTEVRRTGRGFFRRSKDPVKVTALLYLKEALIGENYEDCADFVRIAREFGALDFEIQNILENPRGAFKFTPRLK